MPSAKQIAWRKKVVKMSKAGVFRSTKKGREEAKERSKYVADVDKQKKFQADFDKLYNISALKKRLSQVRKENDKIYIKTGKLDQKLLRETNDILKRLKVASRNPERYGKY